MLRYAKTPLPPLPRRFARDASSVSIARSGWFVAVWFAGYRIIYVAPLRRRYRDEDIFTTPLSPRGCQQKRNVYQLMHYEETNSIVYDENEAMATSVKKVIYGSGCGVSYTFGIVTRMVGHTSRTADARILRRH